MRWVFYSLLVFNLVYFAWNMVAPGEKVINQPPNVFSSEAESIQLLSEVGVSSVAQPQVKQAEEVCVVIGPWQGDAGARKAADEVDRLGYSAEVRPVMVEKDQLSWVYLPPVEDRDAAVRLLRELQGKGVDSFIIDQGEYLNAISLGYFGSHESALGLKTKMRSASYPAEVLKTSKEVTEYWLYVRSSGIEDNAERLREWLTSKEGLEAENVSCQSRKITASIDQEIDDSVPDDESLSAKQEKSQETLSE